MRTLFVIAAAALVSCSPSAPREEAAVAPANGAAPAVDRPRPPEPARTDAIPAAFHGVFDSGPQGCERPSEQRLTVTADELRFHESVGAVRGVTVDSPTTIHVAADYQGEGESWRSVRELRLEEGGARLTVSGEGTSLTRTRCP